MGFRKDGLFLVRYPLSYVYICADTTSGHHKKRCLPAQAAPAFNICAIISFGVLTIWPNILRLILNRRSREPPPSAQPSQAVTNIAIIWWQSCGPGLHLLAQRAARSVWLFWPRGSSERYRHQKVQLRTAVRKFTTYAFKRRLQNYMSYGYMIPVRLRLLQVKSSPS